jgi:hypothetical protein
MGCYIDNSFLKSSFESANDYLLFKDNGVTFRRHIRAFEGVNNPIE